MTATAGHNSKGISQEDMDVLLAIHTRKIIADRRAKQAAAALEKAHEKDAKADGFDVKEIRDYLDVMLSEDQQKHVKKFEMMRKNREKLGVIPPRAKDLFDDRVTREQQIDRDGYEAGLHGLDKTPRHTRGGSEDTVWYDAYDRGRAKYDERWEIILAAMEAAKSGKVPPDESEDPFAFADQ
jgi:hypothetical protein